FLDRRDEAAFAALVERHGATVLATCRAVLKDPTDAEDAFQATFLVLALKARSIRGRAALAGWLYRVGQRIAVRANVLTAGRRAQERPVGDLRAALACTDRPEDDWRPILHEEIARLSEKYRLPIVLCGLEGKTHAQVAGELRWGEATVRRRLDEAKALLRA